MPHSSSTNQGIVPAPGQVISFPSDASLDDSMSSLGSFMSFEDDDENSIEIELDFEIDMAIMVQPSPMKKRTRPRTYGQHHAPRRSPVTSPLSRTQSSPELVVPSKSPRGGGVSRSASRWDMGRSKSCQSSPAHPQRRRLLGGARARPTISTDSMDESEEGVGVFRNSQHSATSLKLKSLVMDHRHSRWSTDESYHTNSAHNNSSGRWQDSFASGNESVSRWSASMSSSQMEQLSIRPRFPRRKGSGLIVGETIVNNGSSSHGSGSKNADWQNLNSSSHHFQLSGSSSHSLWDATETTAAETASFATGRATTGSSAIEDFSMESSDTGRSSSNKQKHVEVDFGIFLSPKKEEVAPKVNTITKPRPQLPHRQKSFRRGGLTMGMAAKAALANKRAQFVKQKSEPSLPDRQASDLTLTSRASSTEGGDSTTPAAAVRSARQTSFRRQQSMPHPQRSIGGDGEGKKHHVVEAKATVQTIRLADLRKQKSLSCIPPSPSMMPDSPQLPERQDSASSKVTESSSRSLGRKQRSLSYLSTASSPQLPQRLPSESSHRRNSNGTLSINGNGKEEGLDESFTEGSSACDALMDCSTKVVIPGPPPLPQRQASQEFGKGSSHAQKENIPKKKSKDEAAAAGKVSLPLLATNVAPVTRDDSALGNRRLSLTKQLSEPNALSLKGLMGAGAGGMEQPIWERRSLDSILLLDGPSSKRQALLASWSPAVLVGDNTAADGEKTTAELMTDCQKLFLPMVQQRSSPELFSSLSA